MSRPLRVLVIVAAFLATAALISACGTETISVPVADTTLHRGAELFSQRCSGCHTLSFAATHGSASNVRTREITNGPNFDQRCERPITRVLYAIENGGFEGAIMPQNVVVGQDARAVAQFVATYAGRGAPKTIGVTPCVQKAVGSLPALTSTSAQPTATTAGAGAAGTQGSSTGASKKGTGQGTSVKAKASPGSTAATKSSGKSATKGKHAHKK